MFYCLYYADEGQYSTLMTFVEARKLQKQFIEAFIVDARTAEVVG